MKTNTDVSIASPKFKAHEQASAAIAIEFLMGLRNKAVEGQIRATHAIRMLHEAHPEMARAVVCKSAQYVGINARTACNHWDYVSHD